MASTGVLRLTCLRSISRTCAFPRLVTPASRTLQLESRRHAGTGGSAPGSGGPRRIKNLWVLGAGVGGIAVLAAMFGAYRAINDREKYIAQAKGTAKEGSTVDYQVRFSLSHTIADGWGFSTPMSHPYRLCTMLWQTCWKRMQRNTTVGELQ